MGNLVKRELELVENPTARIPVCLCLDSSLSMEGEAMDELNEGMKLFFNSVKDDDMAKWSAEVSIVSFGKDVKVVSDFCSIIDQQIPELVADGMTPMGEGVNLSLDLLEGRKREYSHNGVDYYQPWLILMTDGDPNGDPNELQRAIDRVFEMVNNKKLTVFAIGIGKHADMNVLGQFSPKRRPLKLKGLNFQQFFEWLSNSVSRVSQSMPGDVVELDVVALQDWATL